MLDLIIQVMVKANVLLSTLLTMLVLVWACVFVWLHITSRIKDSRRKEHPYVKRD